MCACICARIGAQYCPIQDVVSMSQDIMCPPLFDRSPGRACRDVEKSNSRGRVENRGRKTHQVQGNRPHQAQVATFPMEPAEGARRQECRETESRFFERTVDGLTSSITSPPSLISNPSMPLKRFRGYQRGNWGNIRRAGIRSWVFRPAVRSDACTSDTVSRRRKSRG